MKRGMANIVLKNCLRFIPFLFNIMFAQESVKVFAKRKEFHEILRKMIYEGHSPDHQEILWCRD